MTTEQRALEITLSEPDITALELSERLEISEEKAQELLNRNRDAVDDMELASVIQGDSQTDE